MEEKENLPETQESRPEDDHKTLLQNLLDTVLKLTAVFRANALRIMDMHDTTDQYETVERIKNNISFRGANVWILVFSIFIASIGLNVNSGAVIIGAMLISPLMGPILGMGLAIGTHDIKLFIRSGKNLAVAVVAAIMASTLYFSLTPLQEIQSEILARTKPTILDAMIAFFGGLAGIIGVSRTDRTSNVVPGVAIATALMPPLCTAGFGLATLNFSFFLGAFYLFLINSVFIGIATILIVRYLKFPVVEMVSKERERKAKKIIYASVLVVLIPSAVIFYGVVKETIFKRKANKFIEAVVKYDGAEILEKRIYQTDTSENIELPLIGQVVPDDVIEQWRQQLSNYGLEKSVLKIIQSKDDKEKLLGELEKKTRSGILEEIYKKNELRLKDKDAKIAMLEKELQKREQRVLPVDQVEKEIKLQWDQLESFAYSEAIYDDFNGNVDTLPTLMVNWDRQLMREERSTFNAKICQWMQVRFGLDTVCVVEVSF